MLQEATGGLISRPEGFVIYITTQSDEPPAGVFKEKLDYFRDVRDGKIDDNNSLAVLYEFPEEMIKAEEHLKPENWYITNPNLGRSVSQKWLEAKYINVRSGQDEEGDSVQSFLAKHLNVQIGMNNRANRWAGASYWEQAADPELSKLCHFDALEAFFNRVEVVVVGVDGGGLDDLFGLTLVGREPEEIPVKTKVNGVERTVYLQRWLSWSHAWCHKDVLKRRKKIAPILLDISADGHLTIVDDAQEDLASVVDIIRQVKERELLAGVAVDPAGLGELVDALAMPDVDVTEENGLLIGVSQGFALMNAIKTAERRLSNGMLRHSGGKLMTWCVSNLKIEATATAIRATKQTAGDAKIDPAMALFDAVTVMVKNPEAQRRASVYENETHELLVV
jgi:phage terminase large subunit-like protein